MLSDAGVNAEVLRNLGGLLTRDELRSLSNQEVCSYCSGALQPDCERLDVTPGPTLRHFDVEDCRRVLSWRRPPPQRHDAGGWA